MKYGQVFVRTCNKKADLGQGGIKMKRLHVHSVVDAITNSSTEIYTFLSYNAIAMAKEALGKWLTFIGVKETVDDLFDIQVSAQCYDRKTYEEKTTTIRLYLH